MKEQIKALEKIQLSKEEIDNLSDAEFNTLVITMLTDIECGHKIKEDVKAIQSEIKKNIQGTNSEGKETRTQINNLEQEEINIQPEQNEETRIQKNEERLRNLRDNFKHQEGTTFVNLYALNIGAPKHIKHILMDLKEAISQS